MASRASPGTRRPTPRRPYIFGNLTAKSVGGTLRASYTFTPTLTLQTYAQLFLASGHYSNLEQVVPMRQADQPVQHLADRRTDGEHRRRTIADFEEAALNVNVVLRWEYHLGSTLFLVYSRSQIPTVDLLPTDVAPAAPVGGPARLGGRRLPGQALVLVGVVARAQGPRAAQDRCAAIDELNRSGKGPFQLSVGVGEGVYDPHAPSALE